MKRTDNEKLALMRKSRDAWRKQAKKENRLRQRESLDYCNTITARNIEISKLKAAKEKGGAT